jgi:hypothetical protein
MAGRPTLVVLEDSDDEGPKGVYDMSSDDDVKQLPLAGSGIAGNSSARLPSTPSQRANQPSSSSSRPMQNRSDIHVSDAWKRFQQSRAEMQGAQPRPVQKTAPSRPSSSSIAASGSGSSKLVPSGSSKQTTLNFAPTNKPPSSSSLKPSSSRLDGPDPSFAEPARKRIDFTTMQKQIASPPKADTPKAPMAGFGAFSIGGGSSGSKSTSTSSRNPVPSSAKLASRPIATAKDFEAFRSNRFGSASGMKTTYQTPGSFHTFGTVGGPKPPSRPPVPPPKPASKPTNNAFSALLAESKAESVRRPPDSSMGSRPGFKPGVPVRTDLKVPVSTVPSKGKAFPHRGGGRTVFDSSTLAEDDG